MRAIDTNRRYNVPRLSPVALLASGLVASVLVASAFFGVAQQAAAGSASTGKLAFEPCTRCHPVAVDASGNPIKPLPNGFKKHEITLEVHDILGAGDTACLACHESPQKNPGKLLLADGSTVDVTGDISRVCQRCHFEKYREWKSGIHGKHADKCTAAGCHDPHTPSWIYVAALPPFQGTGMEVKAVGADREGFKPLAAPPVNPPVYTPAWLAIFAAIGAVTSLGAIAYLVKGRSAR